MHAVNLPYSTNSEKRTQMFSTTSSLVFMLLDKQQNKTKLVRCQNCTPPTPPQSHTQLKTIDSDIVCPQTFFFFFECANDASVKGESGRKKLMFLQPQSVLARVSHALGYYFTKLAIRRQNSGSHSEN